jgi:hypothetical protein
MHGALNGPAILPRALADALRAADGRVDRASVPLQSSTVMESVSRTRLASKACLTLLCCGNLARTSNSRLSGMENAAG